MNNNFLAEAVRSAFGSIINDYGFVVTESESWLVRLESGQVIISITYDFSRSYEVSVGVCKLVGGVSMPNPPFNLGEVFRAAGAPTTSRVSCFQSTNMEEVSIFLIELAKQMGLHCQKCLCGDDGMFTALQRLRSAEASEYTREVQLNVSLKRANEAWKNKRYDEFVLLLKEFVSQLSDSDKRKFEYAMEHGGRSDVVA
jgi:hypothetical protein